MELQALSRLVRDLCRQHELDRAAWREFVDAANDHAKRIDTLEHEALQVNDEMARVLDGQSRMAQASMREVMEAVKIIEHNLKTMVDATKVKVEALGIHFTVPAGDIEEY